MLFPLRRSKRIAAAAAFFALFFFLFQYTGTKTEPQSEKAGYRDFRDTGRKKKTKNHIFQDTVSRDKNAVFMTRVKKRRKKRRFS